MRARLEGVDLATLTEYAVGARYPDDAPDEVTAADAAEAVALAEHVVGAVGQALQA